MDYFRGYFRNVQRIVRKSFCVYFDILGFSKKVETTFKSDHKDLSFFNKYLSILDDELKFIRKYGDFQDKNSGRFSIKIFTDNFVIGHPWYDEFGESELANLFTVISHIQTTFIENDIFIRGAIALSDLHMDENIVLGPALIEAYDLESKHARVPRIILSKDVEAMVKEYTGYYANPATSPQNSDYLRDQDGFVFLNYLHKQFDWNQDKPEDQRKCAQVHKDSILRNAAAVSEDYLISQKYVWVAEYHNYFIREFMQNDLDLLINMGDIENGIRRILQ